jgi:hypothetical protein
MLGALALLAAACGSAATTQPAATAPANDRLHLAAARERPTMKSALAILADACFSYHLPGV